MSDTAGAGNVDKAPDAFRTISEVADDLDVPQHVLRFWETRFTQIKPMKRGGGRRYYRPDDVDLLRGIRHLLYGEGYTIRGVQRILKDNGVRFVQSVWRSGAPQPEPPRAEDAAGADREAAAAVAVAAQGDAYAGEGGRRNEPPAQRQPPARPRLPAAAQAGEAVPPARVRAPEPEAPASVPASLAREDVRKLQSTLYELGECRRLLEVALKDEG
jgi:DNA-binding transcriptional MerR regulator